jgi:gliding motility-associated-like protein
MCLSFNLLALLKHDFNITSIYQTRNWMIRLLLKGLLLLLFLTGSPRSAEAQFAFTSGPLPMCDTSYFTANVSGIGMLEPPGWGWGYYLVNVCINITTNHPQTLVITLTSPAGTTLLLSAYNGAGGSNYTNCCFEYSLSPNITTGTAPFTGSWTPQGGSLSIFDWEFADGTWLITVIDTACQGGTGTGGPWVDGYFGGAGSSAGTIGFGTSGPPPCQGFIPDNIEDICPGETVDILGFYVAFDPSYSYSIYDMAGNLVGNPSSVSVPGTYMIIGTDWMGCSYNAYYTINLAPPLSLGPDQVINQCSGSPVDLNSLFILTGLMINWSYNGAPISVAAASVATLPGNYQIIAQNSYGCYDTALVTLSTVAGFSLGPDQNVTECYASGYDLTALYNTAGLTATWYFNGNPVINPSAVTGTGNYMLIATDAGGCIDTAEVSLTISPGFSLGPDQLAGQCNGVPVNLNSMFMLTGLNVTWTYNGVPISVAAASSATLPGNYQVIAQNAAGCYDTAQVTFNIIPGFSLGPDQNISYCSSSTYDLTTLYNTTGLSVTWLFNGNPVGIPSAVSANGNYVLVATDPGGCTDTAQVLLTITPGPVLGPDQNIDVCSGGSANLTTLYSTGINSVTWYYNGNVVNNPSGVSNPGVYMLIAVSPAGCADTAEVILTILPAPAIGSNQSHTVCSNSTLNLTSLYNTTGYSTSWTLNGAPVSNPSAVNVAGTYVLVALSSNGCSDTAQVIISNTIAPALGSNQNVVLCPGNTVNLTNYFVTTGYNVSWTLAGNPVSNPSSVNGPGNYQLVVISPGGCSDTAFVNVNAGIVPAPGPNQQITACEGTIINLNGLFNIAGSTVNWSSGGAPVPNPSNVIAAGVYQITLTSSSGCTAIATATIIYNDAPELGNDTSASVCSGSSLDLSSYFTLNGLTANWTLNGILVTDPTMISATGNYQLIATNPNGCNDTAMVSVTVNNSPSLGPDQAHSLCSWMTLDLEALYNVSGLNSTYSFNGQPLTNYTSVNDSGIYTINVIDINGCTDNASVTVTNIECICAADFIYNAKCVEDPVSFQLIADSAIIDAHWEFANGFLPDRYELNPVVEFHTTNSILVTLEAGLSCGSVTVQKYIQLAECADSCHFYLPNAFTPNNDGKNDRFTWYGECFPEEYSIEIYNRFGNVVFQSDNPTVTWDGTYNNVSSPEGVYVVHVKYRLPYQFRQAVKGRLVVLR